MTEQLREELLMLRESYTRLLELEVATLRQELCAKEMLIADTLAAGNNAEALRRAVSKFIQRSRKTHQTGLAMKRADQAERDQDLQMFTRATDAEGRQ